MKIVTVMTTAPRKNASYLEESVDSVVAAGFDCPIIACEPGARIPERLEQFAVPNSDTLGTWQNSLTAIQLGLLHDESADVVVLFQDDIKVALGLCGWLENQLIRNRNIEIAHLFTPTGVQELIAPGWSSSNGLALPGPARLSDGMCCAVLRRKTAEFLVKRPGNVSHLHMADMWLWEFSIMNKIPMWRHKPSLVEHIGAVSAIARSGFGSGSTLTECRVAGDWIEDLRNRD